MGINLNPGKVYNRPENFIEMFSVGMARDIPDFVPNKDGMILNLGAGEKLIEGTVVCDWPEFDFNDRFSLGEFEDEEIGGIYAFHIFEHLFDPRDLLRECGRVLAHGAPLNIVVPWAKCELAFEDMDHKKFFVSTTWDTLLDASFYKKNKDGFPFTIGANAVMGIVERNMAVVTQLIKV